MLRWLYLAVIACCLWLSVTLSTGRPPVEAWPSNTPTAARLGIIASPMPACIPPDYHPPLMGACPMPAPIPQSTPGMTPPAPDVRFISG